MKRIMGVVVIVLSILAGCPYVSQAGEMDILVDKLVEKGILTPVEARIILDETKQQVSKELAENKSYAVPEWVQKTKLKGDFRLRHQYERKGKELQSRNRGRIRYRLGIKSEVTDTVKIGAGLASGSDDPRSTNQTLDNTFDTPDIRLDYAFAQWKPDVGMSFIVGKFGRNNYLWAPTDLLWDGDINPEGASLHLDKSLNASIDGFLNSGVWILEEVESGNSAALGRGGSEDHVDPFLTYVQGGLKWKSDGLDATAAAIYYGFHGVQGIDFPFSKDTNTKFGGTPGFLMYDYDSYGFSGEAGIKNPFGFPIERLAVFGDYIKNVDPHDQNMGMATGFKFGDKKVSNKGQWQAKYIYAWLGRDAFLDTFPDSDRLGGDTNVKGHEAIFEYGLNKNIILGLDYYRSDRIKGSSATTGEHLVQSDIVFKF